MPQEMDYELNRYDAYSSYAQIFLKRGMALSARQVMPLPLQQHVRTWCTRTRDGYRYLTTTEPTGRLACPGGTGHLGSLIRRGRIPSHLYQQNHLLVFAGMGVAAVAR